MGDGGEVAREARGQRGLRRRRRWRLQLQPSFKWHTSSMLMDVPVPAAPRNSRPLSHWSMAGAPCTVKMSRRA